MNEELIAKEKEALKDLHNEIWKPVKGFESIL